MLAPEESLLFDFPANRVSASSMAFWDSRYTHGRLTITTQRIAYRASKRRLTLRRSFDDAGDIDIEFSDVLMISESPWRTRALWGLSGFPGMLMLEVRRRDQTVVRFAQVQKHSWNLAKDDVRQHCSIA
jgi:hypothetical protein